jgi:glycosyltransferase 2 family protein
VLPLRAGELARVVFLPQVEPVSPVEALSTIVVERVVDNQYVILMLGAVAPLVPVPQSAARPVALLAAAMLVLAALLVIAATKRAATLRLVARVARHLPHRFRSPAERHADAAIDGLAALRSPGAAIEVAVLSVLVYLLLGGAMAAQLAAFHVKLGPAGVFFLLAAATLGLVIPSSPGAVGVWEGIVIGALTGIFSIDRSPATAVALVSHVVFFAPPMFFGAFYLSRFGVSWGRVLGLSEGRTNPQPAGGSAE